MYVKNLVWSESPMKRWVITYLGGILSLNESTIEVFPPDLDQISGSWAENQMKYCLPFKGQVE